jgi:uncharacterized membrane protein
MARLLRYLFQGMLYVVPMFITIWVIVQLFASVGETVERMGIAIHPILDPFIGLIIVISLLVIIGAMGSTLIFKPLFNLVDTLIERAPLIKIIYTSVKDLLSAFVGSKKKFNRPVIVVVNHEPLIERLGYITGETLNQLQVEEGKAAVYLPLSYSLAGDLIIIDKKHIRPVDMNSAEFMKFIVSGGVADVE